MDKWTFTDIEITTELDKVNRKLVFEYLHHQSYWSKDIPRDILNVAIDNSVNFSVFYQTSNVPIFIGFARLVTDYSTAAYLCDVFILPNYQGRGYGKYLLSTVIQWIENHNIRTSLLLTRDAQDFYRDHNWVHPEDPQRVMRYKKANPNFYSSYDQSKEVENHFFENE